MKFFKNNKALTLAELMITLAITWIVLTIISVFITDSIAEITDNDIKISSFEQNITFKDSLDDFFASWVWEVKVFSWITAPTYSRSNSPNNIIFLQNIDSTSWLLVWWVNFDTKLLQRNNIYWKNFLWFRELSAWEINEINSNSGAIYSKEFNTWNIFDYLRIKEFKANYNNNILNIDYILNYFYNEDEFWSDYEDVFVSEEYLEKYNLIF